MASHGKVVTKQLLCSLDENDILERGKELANVQLEKDRLEENVKAMKGRIKSAEFDIGRLSRAVKDGEEERDINCRWQFDFGLGVKRLLREDTGEIVEESDLTADERQQSMFDGES